MVRQHKPSSWQPGRWNFSGEIEEDIKKCYPPEVMSKIVATTQLQKITTDADKQTELAKIIENNIIKLGVWTRNWATLPDRPTPAQRRSTLKKVETAAHTLNELLEALDGDCADDLRRVMLGDAAFSSHAFGTDPDLDVRNPRFGRAKFQALLNITTKLEEWVAAAQENTQKPKDGDKPADIKRWFAEGLIKIWVKIGYEKPTIVWSNNPPKATGALMEFTTAVAKPLGLNPMESALREAIAVWRKTGK